MTVKILQRLLEEWQARKDSNPRPSVLETDALTRLSYAPTAERKFYPTLRGVRPEMPIGSSAPMRPIWITESLDRPSVRTP